MEKQKGITAGLLALYLGLFALLAISLAWWQPHGNTLPWYGNPPDEWARFKVPMYVYESGSIPTGWEEEIRIPGYGFSYGIYNVFPYLVQGWALRALAGGGAALWDLLRLARLVNVASGLLMAYVAYMLAKRLFSDRGWAWVFCFGLMFLPQHLFVHSYVNTDSMSLLATAMMALAVAAGWQEEYNGPRAALLGGGAALCLLSYYNAYGGLVAAAPLFAASFVFRRQGTADWRGLLRWGGICGGLTLALAGWWFLRSAWIHQGDMLGLRTREAMAVLYASLEVNPSKMVTYASRGISIWEMAAERGFWEGAYYSFVAAFGSMSIYGPMGMYTLFGWLFGLSSAAYLALSGGWRGLAAWERGRRAALALALGISIGLPLILLLRYAHGYDYQHQGRYLLPAWLAFWFVCCKGMEKAAVRLRLPLLLLRLGQAAVAVLFVASSVWMVYGRAMPVFLITGRE